MTLTFFVPGKLENPLNGSLSRAHWSKKSRWSNAWKERTRAAYCPIAVRDSPMTPFGLQLPKRITFQCQVGAPWDDDSIPAAIKPVRDALIGLVIDSDAPDSGHVFVYVQKINRRQRGVRVTIEEAEARPCVVTR